MENWKAVWSIIRFIMEVKVEINSVFQDISLSLTTEPSTQTVNTVLTYEQNFILQLVCE